MITNTSNAAGEFGMILIFIGDSASNLLHIFLWKLVSFFLSNTAIPLDDSRDSYASNYKKVTNFLTLCERFAEGGIEQLTIGSYM